MGIKVVNRKYYNQYSNISNHTNWLLGNVGDWQQLILDIEAEITFQGTSQSPLQINYVENTFVLADGSNWGALGFDVGMSIVFKYDLNQDADGDNTIDAVSTKSKEYTIKNIQNDVMFLEESIEADSFELLPINYGTQSVSNVFITAQKDVEGIKFNYSHILNSNYDTSILTSVVDGSQTVFSFPDLTSLSVGEWAKMLPVGYQSGMAISSCEVRKTDTLVNDNDVFLEMSVPNSSYNLNAESVSGENNDFDFQIIPINLNDTSVYRTVSDTRDVRITDEGIPELEEDDCFIYNSNSSFSQDLLFDMIFRILNTDSYDVEDFASIEILRMSGGSNLAFAESINVQSWLNVRTHLGKEQKVSALKTIDVNEGDSFALAIKIQASNNSFIECEFVNSNIRLSNINSVFRKEGVQFFQIKVDYMIAPFFDSSSSFEPLQYPNFALNNESLTDNFDIQLFPVWNNPNVQITNDNKQTKRLGNTGWFDENFNGLENNFVVESLQYKDEEGNEVSSLDYTQSIIVEVIVSGVENTNANTEFGIGFSWIPQDEDDYYNKKTPYHENLFVSTGRIFTDGINDSFNLGEITGSTIYQGSSSSNAKMNIQANENVLFQDIGNNQIRLSARFIPSAEFVDLFNEKSETDRKYILWLSCAYQSLGINFSNRVSLLIDYNEMVKNVSLAGVYPDMSNFFLEHQQESEEDGVYNYVGFLEDDVLSRLKFSIDTEDSRQIRSMTFGYEVLNTQSNTSFELERYSVNLSGIPINNQGIQEININESRGFNLQDGNNKNWVKINRDFDNDNGTKKAYKAFYATKIRWEDWLQKDGVPSEFYNNSLENNGSHNNWLDYLRNGIDNEYCMNFFVYTEVLENNEISIYKNTYEIYFHGYDENENILTEHNYYRDSDDTLINVGIDDESGNNLGLLLQNEPTRIEITYQNLVEDFDINSIYAVIGLESENGAGQFEYRQLSSVWGSESTNILIPLEGEENLKIEQISPRVIKTSCLIDNTKLINSSRYKITGRIGCSSAFQGIYENAYENAYE